MNGDLIQWVETSCHPIKAKVLIKAMSLLLTTMDPSIEEIWLMYLTKVGIADDQTNFDNLQQVILDSTISSIEQYSIQIQEHVGFAEQSKLNRLLQALLDLDSSELVSDIRTILSDDSDDLDKLLRLISLVAEDPSEDFSELIEDFSPLLLKRISEVYELPTEEERIADKSSPELSKLRGYLATLVGDDEILDFARNLDNIKFDFSHMLSLMSGRLLELVDPLLFTTRLIVLYLCSTNSTNTEPQFILSDLISKYAPDGNVELECLRILQSELRKL